MKKTVLKAFLREISNELLKEKGLLRQPLYDHFSWINMSLAPDDISMLQAGFSF